MQIVLVIESKGSIQQSNIRDQLYALATALRQGTPQRQA
jgi:hypothetical protein